MSASAPVTTGKPSSFAAFVWFWFKIGCLSFGGPAGQIAMMQNELVDRLKWVGQRRFLHVLNFCTLLPGPEAQQMATYLGWRLYGIGGGLAAGLLFVLPGAAVLFGLSWLHAAHGDAPLMAAVFAAIKPAVVAIIATAVWRIGRRALTTRAALLMAASAFVCLYAFDLPFPLVVLGAGVVGALAAHDGRHWFSSGGPGGGHGDHGDDERLADEVVPTLDRLLWLVLAFVVLWAVPALLVIGWLGAEPWRALVALFTKAAFVTFGGAYAVLPYVAQQAVEVYGWLDAGAMLDGLALAETTPGPLILVLQYVGYLAGWNTPGHLEPWQAGAIGAGLTLWCTFLPCFLFIFAGAPYVERLIHNPLASGMLAAITAAVVGVILNLGVYLGTAVLWPGGQPAWEAIAVALAALLAMTRLHLAIHWLVLAAAAYGAVRYGIRVSGGVGGWG